jgi:two-component system, NarL family, nitrate/nitrite response regulator NarL
LRVVLADDHEVMRKGLRSLLNGQSRWNVCGEAQNGQEALDLVLELQPDLIVLDISMPVMNGLQAAAKIRKASPATKIVILSTHDSPQVKSAALEAGAHAFVTKSETADQLVRVIEELFVANSPA